MSCYPSIAHTCLCHVLYLISSQLVLLTCGQPHIQKYFRDLIDKFLEDFINLRHVQIRRIYSSEVPYMGSHGSDSFMRMGDKLLVGLGRHSFGFDGGSLSQLNEGIPLCIHISTIIGLDSK